MTTRKPLVVINGNIQELSVLDTFLVSTIELDNYPLMRPSLFLDFTNSQVLDSRITFTRASTATRIGPTGLIESVTSGAPRFDYDPVTLACKGLLIEEQRVNLLLRSQEFNNAAWVTAAPYSVVPNTATAPDGTLTANSLVVASGQSSFNSNVTRQVISKAATATSYVRSVYVKALGATTSVRLTDFGSSAASNASVIVSLVDGAIVTAPTVAGFTAASVTVTAARNGWYCIQFSYTTDTATSLTVRTFPYAGSSALTGDGTSGIYIWGAQLEAGSLPTSYIPTEASQVTRAADVASMTGTNFSSWYRQDEGTFVANYVGIAASSVVFDVNNGTAAERLYLRYLSNQSQAFSVSSSVVQAQVYDNTGLATATAKTAYAYAANSFTVRTNGGAGALAAATDSSGIVATCNKINIGANYLLGSTINGHIRSISYYPKRLTSIELVTLSTQ